jgi:hypothetical protein
MTPAGQLLIEPEYELESYSTSLKSASAEEVQALYHAHGTSEQFHSEIKTDMDLERLPSGKFATNEIVLTLGIFAYNLLRIISQESLKKNDFPPTHHKVKRRRVSSVIKHYINLAVKYVHHARCVYVKLSKTNPWLTSYDACILFLQIETLNINIFQHLHAFPLSGRYSRKTLFFCFVDYR